MKTLRLNFPVIFLFIALGMLLWQSCTNKAEPEPLTIGISKALPVEYYGNYASWLKTSDSSIICIDLYHIPVDSALVLLNGCSGLLISGGPDVFPGKYGQAIDTIKCGTIDLHRDSLEWALIGAAKNMEMPVLGICRGLQIFNIYHDGSLFPDLPTDFDTSVIHRCENKYECYHDLRVLKQSGLFKITQLNKGVINSNHHQGINRLGTGLKAIAHTNDGLIEAIEYEDAENMPFFLGVQWHPERMDIDNPFSLPIATYFLQEAKLFRIKHHASR